MNIRLPTILSGLVTALAFPAFAVAQTYEFTTCGAAGYEGPAQGDCDTTYTATTLDGAVTVTGGIQTWTVPATGTYRITAIGAAGYSATDGEFNGGRGARVSGSFDLTAGDILQIAVGQMGSASQQDEDGKKGVVDEALTSNEQAEGPAAAPSRRMTLASGASQRYTTTTDRRAPDSTATVSRTWKARAGSPGPTACSAVTPTGG